MNKILFALLLMLSINVHASFKTGNELLMACDSTPEISAENAMPKVLCVGYVSGMVDAIQILFGRFPEIQSFCLPPKGMSGNQKILIVEKYLKENPNQLHHSARMSVYIAFFQAFPCE